jgi:hypothetical protein
MPGRGAANHRLPRTFLGRRPRRQLGAHLSALTAEPHSSVQESASPDGRVPGGVVVCAGKFGADRHLVAATAAGNAGVSRCGGSIAWLCRPREGRHPEPERDSGCHRCLATHPVDVWSRRCTRQVSRLCGHTCRTAPHARRRDCGQEWTLTHSLRRSVWLPSPVYHQARVQQSPDVMSLFGSGFFQVLTPCEREKRSW